MFRHEEKTKLPHPAGTLPRANLIYSRSLIREALLIRFPKSLMKATGRRIPRSPGRWRSLPLVSVDDVVFVFVTILVHDSDGFPEGSARLQSLSTQGIEIYWKLQFDNGYRSCVEFDQYIYFVERMGVSRSRLSTAISSMYHIRFKQALRTMTASYCHLEGGCS